MIAMHMNWKGITPDLYDQVRNIVKWETNQPEGGLFHAAFFDNDGLRVTDLWESPEHLNNFVNNRLMPGVAQTGITSQPNVEVYPVHALFTPGFEPKAALELA